MNIITNIILTVNAITSTAKARKGNMSVAVKLFITSLTNGSCHLCGRFVNIFSGSSHIDHLKVWKWSKSNAFNNLGVTCDVCNIAKGDTHNSPQHSQVPANNAVSGMWIVRYFTALLKYEFVDGVTLENSTVYVLSQKDCKHRDAFTSELRILANEAIKGFNPTVQEIELHQWSIRRNEYLLTLSV